MIYVSGGTFQMGNLGSVTLSGYYAGKYEVTNNEYATVLNWALGRGYLATVTSATVTSYGQELLDLDDPDCQITYSQGQFWLKVRDGQSMGNHPVVEVTWYGAVAYCNWLSEKDGFTPCYDLSTWERLWPLQNGYRLLTEAEWERVAGWDTYWSYLWGYGFTSDTIDRSRCNYVFSNPLGLTSGPSTTPAGYYNGHSAGTLNSPSPVGAYDMSGNVWEWCHDRHGSYPAPPLTNPTGPGSGYNRVLRGGSWTSDGSICRTTTRGSEGPNISYGYIGFRLAK
jgi:formylglycine-generating enzyme required for sulfatase activity